MVIFLLLFAKEARFYWRIASVTSMALLVNPTNPSIAEPFSRALQAAARALGLQLHVLHASSEREIEAAFATLVKLRAGGLVIMPDQLFLARTEQLAALTVRHAVPSVHLFREFAAAGGLMSYRSDEAEYYGMIGGIEETSASFEVRSAPRSYLTPIRWGNRPASLRIAEN
jgi:hypothetical protein